MALRNQEIAQRIRALREARGNPPQPIVAAALHVSLRTYQNWEAGDAKPEYRNLEALAGYFRVSEEYILTGRENAQPESPVVVSTQMDEGFEEFREHVQEINRKLDLVLLALGVIQEPRDEAVEIPRYGPGLPPDEGRQQAG